MFIVYRILTTRTVGGMNGKMITNEYGSLKIPDEVLMLIRLEEDLQKEGKSLDTIGFIPIVTEFAYSITPIDVIPFANTGGDGIHFGFLTDFGQISDLNDAPIVCVSPTNDPPIRLIASTLQEFLRMAISVPHVELLESCWPGDDEERIADILEEYRSDDYQKKRDEIFIRIHEAFKTDGIDVVTSIKHVNNERNNKIILPTYDGLGILPIGDEKAENRYQFDPERRQDEKELARMRAFLSGATTVEKLGFIRDASYWYVLAYDYDDQILNLVGEILQSLQLEDELTRFKFRNQ